MKQRQIAPRGLSRTEAASYLGISVETFDRAAEDGLLPQPRRLYEKRVWDIDDLNQAFTDLPHWNAEDRRRGGAGNDNSHAPMSEQEEWLSRQK